MRVTVPASDSERVRENIIKLGEKVEREEMHEQDWEVVSHVPEFPAQNKC